MRATNFAIGLRRLPARVRWAAPQRQAKAIILIHVNAARLIHAVAWVAILLRHSEPAASRSQIPALLRRLGAIDLVTVKRRPLPECRSGDCYHNVALRVRSCGGKICYGWMILELDRLALLAWHHAIWRDAAGSLIDISAHPLTGRIDEEAIFAIDPRQDYRLDWPLAKPLIVHPLIDSEVVQRFAAAELMLNEIRTQYFDLQMSLPSARFSSADATVRVQGDPDCARLRALEAEWMLRIAAAEKERDACLPLLASLQEHLS